jgi:Spy/CpxP family protein refolding chaperone
MGMGGRFRGHRGPRPIISLALRFKEDLKLSEEQVEKLDNLRADFYRRRIGERAGLKTLRFDLRRVLKEDKIDMARAEEHIRAIAQKRGDLTLDRIATIEKGKTILTAGQLKNLKDLLRERRKAHRESMMRGMGERHGSGGIRREMKEGAKDRK